MAPGDPHGRFRRVWPKLLTPSIRRVLVQEFMGGLHELGGASTVAQMLDGRLQIYRVPADEEDLEELAEMSRRLGYVEKKRKDDGEDEWAPTARGFDVGRPSSLDPTLIVGSVVRIAGGTRKQVSDWFPAGAAAIGALATIGRDPTTQNVWIRWLSVILLSLVLLKHVWDEVLLHLGARSWRRFDNAHGLERTVWRFWCRPRIACAVALNAAGVVLYAVLILPDVPDWAAWWAAGAFVALFVGFAAVWWWPFERAQRRLPNGKRIAARPR
jgi:hypothetical protein